VTEAVTFPLSTRKQFHDAFQCCTSKCWNEESGSTNNDMILSICNNTAVIVKNFRTTT
jgi:hypothetical protein